jgi:hypothetical protein
LNVAPGASIKSGSPELHKLHVKVKCPGWMWRWSELLFPGIIRWLQSRWLADSQQFKPFAFLRQPSSDAVTHELRIQVAEFETQSFSDAGPVGVWSACAAPAPAVISANVQ